MSYLPFVSTENYHKITLELIIVINRKRTWFIRNLIISIRENYEITIGPDLYVVLTTWKHNMRNLIST